MKKTTSSSQQQSTSKDRKQILREIENEYLFINLPRQMREKLMPHLDGIEERHIIRLTDPEDIRSAILVHVEEDGSPNTLGCYFCINPDHHRFDTSQQLWIAGAKAIPLSKRVGKIPADMQMLQIDHTNLWLCPHCQVAITRWKTIT